MPDRCSRCNAERPGEHDYDAGDEYFARECITLDDVDYPVCPRCKRQLKVFLVGGAVESAV